MIVHPIPTYRGRLGSETTRSASLVLPLIVRSARALGKPWNLGHRAGAGLLNVHADLPENSLVALKAALLGRDGKPPIQFLDDFIYLEVDVQETADHHIVLFHDRGLTRMLPSDASNIEAYRTILEDKGVQARTGRMRPCVRDLDIQRLTLAQIQRLSLRGSTGEQVPELETFLKKCRTWGLKKPLTIDIKHLHSDLARERLICLAKIFREDYMDRADIIFETGYNLSPSGVSLIAHPHNFARSCGDEGTEIRAKWSETLFANDFEGVHQAVFHGTNLCSREWQPQDAIEEPDSRRTACALGT